jgi:hypothetical protein
MQSKRFFAGVVLLGLGCSGADQPEPGSSDEGAGEAVSSADAPVVYVVNYPLAYLAERTWTRPCGHPDPKSSRPIRRPT